MSGIVAAQKVIAQRGDVEFSASLKGLKVVYLAGLAGLAYAGVFPALPGGVGLVFILGLAAFRAARAVSYNQVFEDERRALGVIKKPDSSGAGDSEEATGSGVKRALGELVCCPICSGQWAALFIGLSLIIPRFGAAVVWVFAAAGVSELVHWVAEAAEWEGRRAREEAGRLNRDTKKGGEDG